jgi:hypothetical protein
MNNLQEYIRAEELISICNRNTEVIKAYSYQSGQLIKNCYNIKDIIEDLLNNDINLLNQREDNNFKQQFVIIEILHTDIADDIKEMILKKITKEQLNNLPEDIKIKLLKQMIEYDSASISILFDLGFRIIQGNMSDAIEYERAENGDYVFFNILMEYQPDFDLENFYTNEKVTLLEVIKESLDFITNPGGRYRENLEKTALYIDNFLKIKFFKKLEDDISINKEQSISKMKI